MDATRARVGLGRRELGAGGDDGDTRRHVHVSGRAPGRAPQGDERRRDGGPGRGDDRPGRHVLAAGTHVLTRRRVEVDGDMLRRRPGRARVGALDRDDGNGAVGDPGPGHDPRSLAGREHEVRGGPGRHVADHPIAALVGRTRAHGIPVHGRVVEAWQVVGSDEVGGQAPPRRMAVQRHPLQRAVTEEPRHGGAVICDGHMTHGRQSVAFRCSRDPAPRREYRRRDRTLSRRLSCA